MRHLAPLLATVLLLAGCGAVQEGASDGLSGRGYDPPTSEAEMQENVFVEQVQKAVPQLQVLSREQVLDLGDSLCDSAQFMNSELDILAYVEGFVEGAEGSMSARDVVAVMGAASVTICPKEMEKVSELMGSKGP